MAPLYTNPAIEYLETLDKSQWRVFEYGGGGSTSYYGAHCREVVVVEHNQDWVNNIKASCPDATVLMLNPEDPVYDSGKALDAAFDGMGFSLPIKGEDVGYNRYHGLLNDENRGYASAICQWDKGYFNCVVVDGMARSRCLWYAMHMVAEDGLVILDNSDRWHFNDVQCHLIANGFNRIDFWQPGHPCWCTSFFSRSNPVLDADCRRPENSGDIYHY